MNIRNIFFEINKLPDKTDDTWTTSRRFKEDLIYFFTSRNSKYSVAAEIGIYKGYTTRILSFLFEKVYAIDSNLNYIEEAKQVNNDRTNIEYIHLDAYEDEWNFKADVVLIDAVHQAENIQLDVDNSKKVGAKYLIFDDYGLRHQDKVRGQIDNLIENKTLRKVANIGQSGGWGFIPQTKSGKKNPNSRMILPGYHEGLICEFTNFNLEESFNIIKDLSPNSLHAVYKIVEDNEKSKFFIIEPKRDIVRNELAKISDDNKKKIIQYSQQTDNKIIEIYNISKNKIITKYYEDYYPLVITRNCDFYGDILTEQKSAYYNLYMEDLTRAEKLYNKIVDEYNTFVKNTGYMFWDMSSNNILINKDYTDFRIIDVSSLLPYGNINHPAIKRFGWPMIINPRYLLGYIDYEYIRTGYIKNPEKLEKLFLKIDKRVLGK